MNIDRPSSMWRQSEVILSVVTLVSIAAVCLAFQYANLQRKIAVDIKTAELITKMKGEIKLAQSVARPIKVAEPVVASDDVTVEPANNSKD